MRSVIVARAPWGLAPVGRRAPWTRVWMPAQSMLPPTELLPTAPTRRKPKIQPLTIRPPTSMAACVPGRHGSRPPATPPRWAAGPARSLERWMAVSSPVLPPSSPCTAREVSIGSIPAAKRGRCRRLIWPSVAGSSPSRRHSIRVTTAAPAAKATGRCPMREFKCRVPNNSEFNQAAPNLLASRLHG